MRCEEFTARLEEPALQEGGPWPLDLLDHAHHCPHCAEILAIFQAIPSQVSTAPRDTAGLDEPLAVVLQIQDGIPRAPTPFRRLWRAITLAAAVALAWLHPSQLSFFPSPATVDPGLVAQTLMETVVEPLASAEETAGEPRELVEATGTLRAPTRAADRTAAPEPDPIAHDGLADDPPEFQLVLPTSPRAAIDIPPPTAASESAKLTGDGPLSGGATRSASTRSNVVAENFRIRISQGVLLMPGDWSPGAGYGGEIGVQQRFWFHQHVGFSLGGGVRYGVTPGFDALPDDKPRRTTGGTVAGTGNMMVAIGARPAMVALGVGLSAGEWDPGPSACGEMNRNTPQRSGACEEWSYLTPDLIAALEFDVNPELRLGLRWSGHDQGYEMGRAGDVELDGRWINRVTLEATFQPGAATNRPLLARKSEGEDDGKGRSRLGLVP